MSNPYAPPQAAVLDIVDPRAQNVLAERLTRLGAAILDGIIFAGMVYVPMLIGFVLAGMAGADEGEDLGNGLLVIGLGFGLVGLVVWSWITIVYVKRNGQTIGKKITGIKVVRRDGSAISLGRIFWLRNVVNALIGIIPLYSVIELLFIFGETQQCLHDKIADSIVVRA
jgi:uncharacterized RDD family membrane protein YckC